MAGTSADFDSAAFRTNIQSAMNMGLPVTAGERPIFIFPSTSTYPAGTALDENGRPFDLTITPVITAGSQVSPTCSVQWGDGMANTFDLKSVGEFDKGDVVITLLDTDYATVKGAPQVKVGGDIYDVTFVEPPVALFDVTVYRVHAHTVNET